ncbi:MAG: SDR family NAD(P)-dependent oxidoreductase [Novosphingobium sp.]|nr:SDR family NAD(P)-dependent oxidoreductase [Novosphingobium sp.]
MVMAAKPTAFVTGGGSGIGRALAKALAARGTTVCIADLNVAAAEAVARECGGSASHLALDVRDADAVKTGVEAFVQENGRLDYMFNNAGIGIAGEVDDIALPAWQRIIDINLYGVLHGVLAAYPIMLRQGFGHIVNTASLAGLGPAPLFTPYALTKHAVVGLSTSLRIEAASRGVRVSVVCPAAVETPLLDTDNPADLGIGWAPDARRFLTALAGPPYPVETCADDILAALGRNMSVIVLPGRARLAWRLGRLFPALVEKIGLSAVAKERSTRA